MKLNGTPITELEHFDVNTLRKLTVEGKKQLKSDPDALDAKEKALLLAAENVLSVFADFKKHCENGGQNIKLTLDADNMANVAVMLSACYHTASASGMEKKRLDETIAEKTASILLFEIWNLYHKQLPEEELADEADDGKQFDAFLCLDYGADIAAGRECFRKLGIHLVNQDDSSETWYFDALKLGREFVREDLLIVGEGFAADAPYFAYRVGCALHPDGASQLERPIPLRTLLKQAGGAAPAGRGARAGELA